MTSNFPRYFPQRGPRVVAMLIKIEKEDGSIAYVSANEYQLAGSQLVFEQEVDYHEFTMYPGEYPPHRRPTGESHQRIIVDELRGYTMTVRPPGNWDNKPELADPNIVEEDTDGEDSGPRALPGN